MDREPPKGLKSLLRIRTILPGSAGLLGSISGNSGVRIDQAYPFPSLLQVSIQKTNTNNQTKNYKYLPSYCMRSEKT